MDDIGPDTDWRAALAGVDAVVHLAARAHVLRDSSADAHALYRAVNTLGALRLAEAAAAAGSGASCSSARYGCTAIASRERLSTSRARSWRKIRTVDPRRTPSGASPRSAPRVASQPVILRPPLVYGPGARGNFARLVALVARGVPLPLGAVHNRRSLVFVGNLVDAIVRSLDHPAAAGETFMVSDGEDLSTPELVRRIARALGKPARLVPVPPRPAPPRRHARRPLG